MYTTHTWLARWTKMMWAQKKEPKREFKDFLKVVLPSGGDESTTQRGK
jgi:hypothetical protein